MPDNNIRILSEPISYQELKSIHGLKITGIYKIENLINHKVYIGQSKNVISRLRSHTKKYRKESERNADDKNDHLRNSFEKYGLDNFSFEVLKVTYDLNYWEIFLIQIYHSTDDKFGYNVSIGGTYGGYGDVFSKHVSEGVRRHYDSPEGEKTRILLRNAALGKEKSSETIELTRRKSNEFWNSPAGQIEKERNSIRHKGRKQSKEEIEKRRKSNTGLKRTPEQNKKNSEIVTELWKNSEYRQRLTDIHKKLRWWTNGVKDVQAEECPLGFRRGRCSEAMLKCSPKGKKYFNNGEIEVMRFECPPGFVPGRCPKAKEAVIRGIKLRGGKISDIQKQQISKANKGRHYYNNGAIEIRAFECPEGFVTGRVPKDRSLSAKKISESLKKFNSTSEGKLVRERSIEIRRRNKSKV